MLLNQLKLSFYLLSERGKNMRADLLTSVLTDLNGTSADIEASGIISTDGLMIASVLPASMDEDRVGAMSAAMLSLGDRTAQELARGTLEQVLIKGAKGYVLMTYAGSDAVLTVLAKPNAKLGLIFLDVKRAAETIIGLLE
jgi:predicted regulator of Ras-like GTPase activity (Roadblock/LC7/MglB family)